MSDTGRRQPMHRCKFCNISQIINSNWELINDDMWRNIAAQIGYKKIKVGTGKPEINEQFGRCTKQYIMAVTGDAGTGKSFTLKT